MVGRQGQDFAITNAADGIKIDKFVEQCRHLSVLDNPELVQVSDNGGIIICYTGIYE